jgi:hypothetical protein
MFTIDKIGMIADFFLNLVEELKNQTQNCTRNEVTYKSKVPTCLVYFLYVFKLLFSEFGEVFVIVLR